MATFLDNPIGSINSAIGSASILGVPLSSFRPSGPPQTKTRTSHAFTLYISPPGRSPRLIGAGQTLNMSQSRAIDEEYEVSPSAVGIPVDLIPQIVSTRQLTLDRLDLFLTVLEDLLGTTEIITLSDQFMPLTVREVWRDPTSGSFFATSARSYVYTGCYIKDLGRKIASNDDRIVRGNATLVFKNRFRVT
jgi:hypothetical protein